MTDTLEGRVQDIEDLIADIPQMMNLRLESLTAAQQDASARIGLLDKQMAMIMREMRDLRGGVTRMLVSQDEEIAKLRADVAALMSIRDDVTGLKGQVGRVEANVAALQANVAALTADVAAMAGIHDHVTTIGSEVSEIAATMKLVLARMEKS